MKKLLNYQSGISDKNNKPYLKVEVTEPCTAADNKRGFFGDKVSTVWLPLELQSKLSPEVLGQPIRFVNVDLGFNSYVADIIFESKDGK